MSNQRFMHIDYDNKHYLLRATKQRYSLFYDLYLTNLKSEKIDSCFIPNVLNQIYIGYHFAPLMLHV